MKKEIKYGGTLGAGFAIIAYLVADLKGFNRSSFLYMIYLYIILGAVSKVNMNHLSEYLESLERLLLVTDKEENKLRKIATGEKYKIDGTIKKIGD